MPKILVTGSTGLLGSSLSPWLAEHTLHEIIRHSHSGEADVKCDLTNNRETGLLLENIQPDYIINLVALTDVDKCEAYPNQAYQLNVKTVENLVSWLARNSSSKLIHISTDQVYDGNNLHTEGDVSITNTYAFSKYAAELSALSVKACILRTNFFGNSKKLDRKSFSDWLLSSLQSQKKIKGFTDICFSPLLIQTLCEMIAHAIENFTPGVFNLGSKNGISKADFALLLASTFELDDSSIELTSSNSADLKAYRPKDMRMDSSLFEKTFCVQLPSLSEEISRLRNEY